MEIKHLCVDTPRFTKFTRKELLEALNAREMAPIMKTVDGISVLIEGNAILFFDLSKASKEFTLHYYYLTNTNKAPLTSPRSRKYFLPRKALIVRQLRDSSYVYMGVANLKLLYRKRKS